MVGLLLAALAGLVISLFFRTGLLVLACAAFLLVDILRVIAKAALALDDILILFAYLSALQGGFMLGAYLKHRRPGGNGS